MVLQNGQLAALDLDHFLAHPSQHKQCPQGTKAVVHGPSMQIEHSLHFCAWLGQRHTVTARGDVCVYACMYVCVCMYVCMYWIELMLLVLFNKFPNTYVSSRELTSQFYYFETFLSLSISVD